MSDILGVTFDKAKISQLTVARMDDFFRASRKADMAGQAELIAETAVSCPEEWGKVDNPETYTNRKFNREFKPLIRHFSELVTEADVTEIPELTFDLDAITAKDMGAFFQSVNKSDLKPIADVLTRVVVTCPAKWGTAGDIDTYLKRPYSQFLGIVNRFIREVNEDSKK